MSEHDKPSIEEVKRLLTREARTRIALQTARAREHISMALRGDGKATYHQCRAHAIAATEPEYQRHERARVALLTAAYAINGTLDLDKENVIGP